MTSFNKSKYLDLTLASWCHQTYGDYEIIICDDGTSGGLRESVESVRPFLNVTLIELENRGRAVARNFGVRAASGEVVLFSDDDRMVPRDFIESHLRALVSTSSVSLGYKHQLLSIKSPDIEVPPGKVADSVGSLDGAVFSRNDVHEDLDLVLRSFDLGPGFDNADDVLAAFGDNLLEFRLPWAIATTANMSLRRELLLSVGGFNEGFIGWGAEDTELAFRLAQAGAQISMTRAALNYHQVHPRRGNPTVPVAGGERVELFSNLRYFAHLHPCLETYLFYRVWVERMSLVTASKIIDLIASADESIVVELTKAIRDSVPIERLMRAGLEEASVSAAS